MLPEERFPDADEAEDLLTSTHYGAHVGSWAGCNQAFEQCSVWILMDFDGFCPESFLCPQSNLLCPSVSFPWWSRACYNLGASAGFRCSAAFWLKHHDEKEGKLLIYKSSIWTSKGEKRKHSCLTTVFIDSCGSISSANLLSEVSKAFNSVLEF